MSKIKIVSHGTVSVGNGNKEEMDLKSQLRIWFPRAIFLEGKDFYPDLRIFGNKMIIIRHPRIYEIGWTPDFMILQGKREFIIEHKSQQVGGTMEQKLSHAYDMIELAGKRGIVTLSGEGFSPSFMAKTRLFAKKRKPFLTGVFRMEMEKRIVKRTIKNYFQIK